MKRLIRWQIKMNVCEFLTLGWQFLRCWSWRFRFTIWCKPGISHSCVFLATRRSLFRSEHTQDRCTPSLAFQLCCGSPFRCARVKTKVFQVKPEYSVRLRACRKQQKVLHILGFVGKMLHHHNYFWQMCGVFLKAVCSWDGWKGSSFCARTQRTQSILLHMQ